MLRGRGVEGKEERGRRAARAVRTIEDGILTQLVVYVRPIPLKVAVSHKGRMVLGGSGKVSFGRKIRENRIQSELYTHSEVVSSPK